jgi:hypothetical protein
MLVIAGRRGQLGNRLFAFANVGAFAASRGLSVANPGFREYAGWFGGTSRDALPMFPTHAFARGVPAGIADWGLQVFDRLNRRGKWVPAVRLDDTEILDFDSERDRALVERLAQAPLAILDGLYLLARRDFIHQAAVIRAFFAPSAAVTEGSRRCLDRARRSADVIVGVHIRQGDYFRQKPHLYHPTREYAELMIALRDLLGPTSVGFLVCSDSPQADDAFPGLRVTRGPGHPAEDLYALAGCDYIVGAPSTFSEWASFYGGVPRYVLRKAAGQSTPSPRLTDFKVHNVGYGRHS